MSVVLTGMSRRPGVDGEEGRAGANGDIGPSNGGAGGSGSNGGGSSGGGGGGKVRHRFTCPKTCVVNNAIVIKRTPITQARFDEIHGACDEPKTSLCDKLKDTECCSKRRLWKTLCSYLPIIKFLRYYKIKDYAPIDILSGLTIGILHIPQALGYGQLASVKIENGMYTSLWPAVMYILFGTSQHLHMGTSAVICILTANVVNRKAAEFLALNPHLNNVTSNGTLLPLEEVSEYMDYKENISLVLALISGAMLIAMGFMKLGFITAYLSESFFSAFASGCALHIAVSQLSVMLGLKVKRFGGLFKIVKTFIAIFGVITEVNFAAIICSVVTIVLILLVKECINERFKDKLFLPVPIELFVVIIGALVGHFGKLKDNYDVVVVGTIPNTIPPPIVPDFAEAPSLIVDCFVLAILIFANTIALGKICAKKHNYELNDSQEMIAYGICNVFSSFFRCFPSAVSPPRAVVSSQMNTRTTLSGIFSCVLMLLVILVISFLFEPLPKSVLGAIIFISLKGLFVQIGDGAKYWRINKFDFAIWLFTILGVVFLDIDFGLGVGVGVSLVTVVFQTQFARGFRLGRTIRDSALVEHKRYPDSHEVKGVKVYRFQSNLFFANAEIFRNKLYSQTVNPRKLLKALKKREAKMKKLGITSPDPATGKGPGKDNSYTDLNIMNRQDSRPSENSETRGYDNNVFTIEEPGTPTVNPDPSCGSEPDRRPSTAAAVIINPPEEEEDPEDGDILFTDERIKEMRKIHHIILDCAPVNYIDASGANVLAHIFSEYGHVNIKVYLAHCSLDMRTVLHHAGVHDRIPMEHIFLELNDAIAMARMEQVMPIQHLLDFDDDEAAEDSCVLKM